MAKKYYNKSDLTQDWEKLLRAAKKYINIASKCFKSRHEFFSQEDAHKQKDRVGF